MKGYDDIAERLALIDAEIIRIPKEVREKYLTSYR